MAREEYRMKMKTNFDRYLEEQLKAPDFAKRFRKAGEAWDVALQIAALREDSGLSQAESWQSAWALLSSRSAAWNPQTMKGTL